MQTVGDGTGITEEQAAKVADIGVWFKGNTAITSFDEFEKFTGVTSLYVGAYQGCTSLSSIRVPNGVTAFNQNSFNGCGALTSFTTDWSKIVTIGSGAFQNCTSLEIEDLSLPNLTSIGQNAFYGVKIKKISNLGNITALPAATTSTQNFGDKSVLEEVVLPSGVTSIGDYSFYGYSALKTLTSSPLKSLGRSALEGCGIENFDFSKIETIGYYALKSCPLVIEDLKIPNLTSLGHNALTGNITRITDLGSITSLPYGGSAFNSNAPNFGNRSTLKSIVVPETVTSFQQFCLYGYNSMDYMVCKPTNPPTLGVGALTYGNISTNNYPIYVPDGSVEQEVDNGDGTTSTVTKTIVELYKEASGWSAYADRIRPMSEYDVRILTYNEDGEGGYKLYQIANYDTAKNDYVMGVAVRDSTLGDIVMSKTKVSGSNVYVDTKSASNGRINTQLMLETYPDTNYVHNKCNNYIFANGTSGYLMSKNEGFIIARKKSIINSALTLIGGSQVGDYLWTSNVGNAGNKWMGVVVTWATDRMDGAVNGKTFDTFPLTELPEGLEW